MRLFPTLNMADRLTCVFNFQERHDIDRKVWPLIFAAACCASANDGWTPLFSSKDLDGCKIKGYPQAKNSLIRSVSRTA